MTIPTYKANVGQYNVPSMNNAGEQANNNLIFEGLASLNKAITKTAMDMYESEKIEEAKKAGAQDVEEGKVNGENLGSLPAGTTAAQQAYNKAAIQHYSDTFNSETTKALNELREKNKNNPAQYYVESEAYLEGVSKNMPAYLKHDILQPVRVHSQSNYSTLLKHHSEEQRKILKETSYVNLMTSAENVGSLKINPETEEERKSNAIARSNFNKSIEGYLGEGLVTAEQVFNAKNVAREGTAITYLNESLKGITDPEKIREIQNNFVLGKTGLKEVDSLPVASRYKFNSFVIEKQSQIDKYQITYRENKLAEGQLAFNSEANRAYQIIRTKPNMPPEEFKEISDRLYSFAETAEQQKRAGEILSGQDFTTSIAAQNAIRTKKINGELNIPTLIQIRETLGVSNADFDREYDLLTDVYVTNTSTSGYKAVAAYADAVFNNKKTLVSIDKLNKAQMFYDQNMNRYLSDANHTSEEIEKFGRELIKESERILGSGNDVYIAEEVVLPLAQKNIWAKDIEDLAEKSIIRFPHGEAIDKIAAHEGSARNFVKQISLNKDLTDNEENLLMNEVMRVIRKKVNNNTENSKQTVNTSSNDVYTPYSARNY